MTVRFFSPQDPEHCETAELLPWFVNGTLEAAERGRVERHVAECVVCRREVQRETELRNGVLASENDEPWRRSFARVQERIDAEERRPWQRITSRWHATGPWVKGAIAAQALLACVLAAALYRTEEAPAYRTLAAAPAAMTGELIVVIFDPTATERAVRQALLDEQAKVVGGPSPEGAYTVLVKSADAAFALAHFRNSAIVRFAERGGASGETGR